MRFARQHFALLDSTSRHLAGLNLAECPEGLCISADAQSGGQGRQGRIWFSPPGENLYFSILLKPAVEPSLAVTLPLLLGVCVAQTLDSFGLTARIKWPNDIWVGERKLCGILCEMQILAGSPAVICGLGINVNQRTFPPELESIATSMTLCAGEPFDRDTVLKRFLDVLGINYSLWLRSGLEPFAEFLNARNALRDKTIAVAQGNRELRGTAGAINADGTLSLLQADGTLAAICSGEAHLSIRRG